MIDLVIQEINNFFLEQGLEEVQFSWSSSTDGRRVFKNKNGECFLISRQGDTYYLEYAENLDEAEIGRFEDMDPYDIEADTVSLVRTLKEDVIKYIINSPAEEPPKV